ncbi:MAG: sigma-70 family RNA polymerase sigma factor [Planctomycetota bacterium]
MPSLDAEFSDHAPFLRALARRVAVDGDAAEDLVQDTFVAALVRGPREHEGLLPWLSTVVRRIGSNRRRTDARRRDREERRAGSAVEVDASVAAAEIEVARRLLAHVEALAEPYRTAVFLRYYEGLPPREIAARTGAPAATVRTRLARALAQLRERLDADDPRGREAWLSSALALGGVGGMRATKAAGAAAVAGGVAVVAVAVTFAVVAGRDVPAAPQNAGAEVETAAATSPIAAPDVRLPVADASRSRAAAATTDRVFAGFVEDAVIGGEAGTGRGAAGVTVEVWFRGVPVPAPTPPSASEGAATGSMVEAGAAPATRRLTETAADGAFEVSLPEGAIVERVVARASETMRAANWRRDRAPADRDEGEPLVLTRFPKGTLLGRVVDPVGGPVAGARVTLGFWKGRKKGEVETYSDANGRFAITETHDRSWLRAEHEDWVLLGATRPSRRPRGGWNDAEVVMSRAGTLELEIVDASGRAAVDVPVFVALLEGEIGTDMSRFDIGGRPMEQLLVQSSRASIRVPSDVRLIVTAGASWHDRMHGGLAIAHDAPSSEGSPIAVPNGGTLSLRAVFRIDVVLRGRVVGPDGAPAVGAEVRIAPCDDRFGLYNERLTADEYGAFEARVASGDERLTLHVTASSPGARPGSRESPLLATRRIEVSGLRARHVEIRLEPRRERVITGRVMDADGRAVASKLTLEGVEADDGEIVRLFNSSYRPTGEEGGFEFAAVPRGVYRLVVRSDDFAEHVVEGVRPGGKPVEVTLSARKPARRSARLRIDAGEDAAHLDVVVARLDARSEANAIDAIDLARSVSPFLWSTYRATVRPEGRVRVERHMLEPDRGRASLALEPGRMWIGITGRDAKFQPLSTISSSLVRIDEDSVVDVEVALRPTVEASGRIVLADSDEPAWFSLVDREGRFFRAMPSSNAERTGRRIFATGRHGHFSLSQVPIGPWEVWVGTREELERGAPRHREPVVAREGERLEITIGL